MSNNIYDILKKIESLEAPKKTNLTESKMTTVKELHNESKKEKQANKGTIAEAVAQVEQQLNEKFHDHKKSMEESGLQAYLGKKKYGETGMKALQKAGREGASKEKMAQIRARHDKMDEGSYNEEMLNPKQKSFAALAEPKDKITYADKIAGAKKGKKTEGNKFSGNLMKARAQGLKQADLDGDGDMEPVRGGKKMGEAVGLDPNLKSPNFDKYNTMDRAQQARTGKYEPDPGSIAAWEKDVQGQAKYKSRTEPGIINKVKDTFGLDKPDPAYGPKDPTPMKEGRKSMREGWEEMQKYLDKKRGPESKGGEGKKAGTRYGGSAQKDDDDEETDGEGKPVEKKKGRPKGTGGGAKFSFKKPKD
jgi:hypothetical protein